MHGCHHLFMVIPDQRASTFNGHNFWSHWMMEERVLLGRWKKHFHYDDENFLPSSEQFVKVFEKVWPLKKLILADQEHDHEKLIKPVHDAYTDVLQAE